MHLLLLHAWCIVTQKLLRRECQLREESETPTPEEYPPDDPMQNPQEENTRDLLELVSTPKLTIRIFTDRMGTRCLKGKPFDPASGCVLRWLAVALVQSELPLQGH